MTSPTGVTKRGVTMYDAVRTQMNSTGIYTTDNSGSTWSIFSICSRKGSSHTSGLSEIEGKVGEEGQAAIPPQQRP